jgi:hypothetical protein
MATDDQVKILFSLTQDSDGYPPVSVESVWAIALPSGTFVRDNSPFFAREATLGDEVEASSNDDGLWFSRLRTSSGSSLLRVVIFDATRTDELLRRLGILGCVMERYEDRKLIAVSVPSSVSLDAILVYLRAESLHGWLDYEEAILRQ